MQPCTFNTMPTLPTCVELREHVCRHVRPKGQLRPHCNREEEHSADGYCRGLQGHMVVNSELTR